MYKATLDYLELQATKHKYYQPNYTHITIFNESQAVIPSIHNFFDKEKIQFSVLLRAKLAGISIH